MNRLTKYTKTIKYSHIGAMLVMALLVFALAPGIKPGKLEGELITMFVNGSSVGTVEGADKADKLLIEARKRIAKESRELVLIKCDAVLSSSKAIFGSVDKDEDVVNNIYEILLREQQKTKQPVYEVKINEFTVNLRTVDEVLELLNRVKQGYDQENRFKVNIVLDPQRELNVLTTSIEDTNKKTATQSESFELPLAGAFAKLEEIFDQAENQDIGGFEFGITSLDFGESVEVVQAYADPGSISTLEEAINMVTKEEEKSQIYVVEPGDTLSVIADKNNTTIDNLIAMNSEIISSASSLLRVGDELKVTSPEPELSVMRNELVYYEENYSADVQYIDNDEWYTNQSKVVQEPVDGFRKVVANVLYKNDTEKSRDIVYEEDVVSAVAKIIERGTKSPPTYMKPISGGRLSSTFGKRKAPKAGASTFHRGVDWAVPTGTTVVASSGGTVIKAGWGSGYGYCVYIQHETGTVTRYGHLSKVLVKSGQYVKQGEKIALSGNTGVSTGPHLHFELLVNGSQVNPLNYLN